MSPLFFQQGIQIADDIQEWVDVAVTLWQSPIDISVKISMACCMRKVTELTFMTPPSSPNSTIWVDIVKLSLWVFSVMFDNLNLAKMFIRPLTLLSVVSKLLTTRTDIEAQNLWMSLAHQILEMYVMKTDVGSCCVSPKRLLKLLDGTYEIRTSRPQPIACFRCNGNFVPCCVNIFR